MGDPASSIRDEFFENPSIQAQVWILRCIAATQIPAHTGSFDGYFLIGFLKGGFAASF